jgi:hypothetical protein
MILPRAARTTRVADNAGFTAADVNRLRPVNERTVAPGVRSPGGTTGLPRWYL